jgi:hypothetical protein
MTPETRAKARASERHPNPDPNAGRICEGCGCTDYDRCSDPQNGKPCHWEEAFAGDLCSLCARVLEALQSPAKRTS